jgi:hypothetical protein
VRNERSCPQSSGSPYIIRSGYGFFEGSDVKENGIGFRSFECSKEHRMEFLKEHFETDDIEIREENKSDYVYVKGSLQGMFHRLQHIGHR